MTTSPPKPHVLVIDDEVLVGRSVRRLLKRYYDVEIVTCGSEALDRVETQSYDVVLCDLMMPEMTGMEFYTVVRERFPKVAERMVFMTGGAFTPSAQSFLETTVRPSIYKPFGRDEIMAVLSSLLNQSVDNAV